MREFSESLLFLFIPFRFRKLFLLRVEDNFDVMGDIHSCAYLVHNHCSYKA